MAEREHILARRGGRPKSTEPLHAKVTVSLPPDQLARLDAREPERPRSQKVCEALDLWEARERGDAPEAGERADRVSLSLDTGMQSRLSGMDIGDSPSAKVAQLVIWGMMVYERRSRGNAA